MNASRRIGCRITISRFRRYADAERPTATACFEGFKLASRPGKLALLQGRADFAQSRRARSGRAM